MKNTKKKHLSYILYKSSSANVLGGKRKRKDQGTWICCQIALFFSQNAIKHEKPFKRPKTMEKELFLMVFLSFFYLGWKTAQFDNKFEFLDPFCFFKHPKHFQVSMHCKYLYCIQYSLWQCYVSHCSLAVQKAADGCAQPMTVLNLEYSHKK